MSIASPTSVVSGDSTDDELGETTRKPVERPERLFRVACARRPDDALDWPFQSPKAGGSSKRNLSDIRRFKNHTLIPAFLSTKKEKKLFLSQSSKAKASKMNWTGPLIGVLRDSGTKLTEVPVAYSISHTATSCAADYIDRHRTGGNDHSKKSSTVLHDNTSTLISVSANQFSVLPIRVASPLSLFLKSHLDEIDDVLLALIVTINVQENSLCWFQGECIIVRGYHVHARDCFP